MKWLILGLREFNLKLRTFSDFPKQINLFLIPDLNNSNKRKKVLQNKA